MWITLENSGLYSVVDVHVVDDDNNNSNNSNNVVNYYVFCVVIY
jgi:hypothetical protein